MEKVGVEKIKRIGSKLVYSHDGRFFVTGSHCYRPENIGGKEYTEVHCVLGYWYIK
jgi:hypothetical protein